MIWRWLPNFVTLAFFGYAIHGYVGTNQNQFATAVILNAIANHPPPFALHGVNQLAFFVKMKFRRKKRHVYTFCSKEPIISIAKNLGVNCFQNNTILTL